MVSGTPVGAGPGTTQGASADQNSSLCVLLLVLVLIIRTPHSLVPSLDYFFTRTLIRG